MPLSKGCRWTDQWLEQIGYSGPPFFQEAVKGPGRIGGTGGRQFDCLHAGDFLQVSVVVFPGDGAVAEDSLYIAGTGNPVDRHRRDIPDAAVAGSTDLAAFDGVPQGDPVPEQKDHERLKKTM